MTGAVPQMASKTASSVKLPQKLIPFAADGGRGEAGHFPQRQYGEKGAVSMQ